MKQKFWMYPCPGNKVIFVNKENTGHVDCIGTVEFDVQPPVIKEVVKEKEAYCRKYSASNIIEASANIPLDAYDVKVTYKQKVPV